MNRHGNGRPVGRLLFLAPNDVREGRVEPIEWMRMCEALAATSSLAAE